MNKKVTCYFISLIIIGPILIIIMKVILNKLVGLSPFQWCAKECNGGIKPPLKYPIQMDYLTLFLPPQGYSDKTLCTLLPLYLRLIRSFRVCDSRFAIKLFLTTRLWIEPSLFYNIRTIQLLLHKFREKTIKDYTAREIF